MFCDTFSPGATKRNNKEKKLERNQSPFFHPYQK